MSDTTKILVWASADGRTITNNKAMAESMGLLPMVPANQPVQVPEGWQLVPVEPTEAMVEAAGLDCVMGKSTWDVTTALWSAMLSAAPSTKEQSNG